MSLSLEFLVNIVVFLAQLYLGLIVIFHNPKSFSNRFFLALVFSAAALILLFASASAQAVPSANAYANPHAATRIGDRTLTYDRNGNLLSDTGGPTQIWNIWNYRNELTNTRIVGPDGVKSVRYLYDASGRRVFEEVRTPLGTTVTRSPTPQYQEITHPDGTVERIVSIEAAGIPVATVRTVGTGTPEVFSTHTDHLRSTRLVTNQTGGVVEKTDYDPFGKITNHTQTGTFAERKKFTSHEFDSATNYTYAKARYLDTEAGRFISQDPKFINNPEQFLFDPQQLNSYSYARNNPLKYIDPDGKKVELVTRPVHVFGSTVGAHAFVLITNTAADASKLVGVPHLNRGDQSRITLGGYEVGGRLVTGANVASDYNLSGKEYLGKTEITPPSQYGGNQTAFENAVLSSYNGFESDLGPYWFLGNGSIGANSNSGNVVTSILLGAGVDQKIIKDSRPRNIPPFYLQVQAAGLGTPLYMSYKGAAAQSTPSAILPRSRSPVGQNESGAPIYCWGYCAQ